MMNFRLKFLIFPTSILVGCGGSIDSNQTATGTGGGDKLSDPLYSYQWHLKNIGQQVFGDTLPTPGVDLNIGSLHDEGIRGNGVDVAVIDSGLEINHEDLINNVIPDGSFNFLTGSTDPTNTDSTGDHGTSVAGIIAAEGWNGKGGRGVAPNAKLRGFNYLRTEFPNQPLEISKNLLNSIGEGPSKDSDVFNMSFGQRANYFGNTSPDNVDSLEKLMRSTRKGKGGIYVTSAGNGFNVPSDSDRSADAICDDARSYNLSCVPSGIDIVKSLATVITVASVNASGGRASYSSSGPNIWVSGLGGEFGNQRKYFAPSSPASLPSYLLKGQFDPAILTTDQSTCDQGYNSNQISNDLDGNTSKIDNSCNYTARFNGTSAAAPTVSGVVALMLQVNPNLTARDVKYILATTSRKIDLAQPVVKMRNLTLDPGWITNAAGHHFSNWYGFGLVDATRAVAAAKTFKSLPPVQDTGWQILTDVGIEIPYFDEAQGASSIAIKDNVKIESVQFSIFTSHPNPANLRVVLTSPSGTRSYLLSPFSALKTEFGSFELSFAASNAFLDEQSAGKWTLQIVDVKNPQDAVGAKLDTWALRVIGH